MLLLGHHMCASNEPPMVAVDKDKPCFRLRNTNYEFLWALLGTSYLSSQAHLLFAMFHNNGP
jgi:hypothetical protein